MRIFLYALVFTSLLLATVVAQDETPYFKEGSKAILFEFRGLDNLGLDSFEGGIGGKYFIQSHLAIRASIQFVSISEDIPFQGTNGVDGEASASLFGLSGAVEYHLNTRRINPYLGGGISVAFSSTESKTAVADPLTQVTIKNNRNGQYGILGGTELTVYALAGVEIFIIDNLSFSAEYQLGVQSLSRKDEEATQGNTTVTTKQGSRTTFGVASTGVLTVSIYL